MASLAHDNKSTYRVLLALPDLRRVAIRLGKMTELQAKDSRANIEALAAFKYGDRNGEKKPPDPEVRRWLAGIGDKLHERLAKAGLVEPRKPAPSATLGALLDDFFACLGDVKPTSRSTYKQTGDSLLRFFGADRAIRDIGPSDCEKWKQSQQADRHKRTKNAPPNGLAKATISRRVGFARSVFEKAVDWERISKNPFRKVKCGSQKNKARMFFVSREDVAKVIPACPDAEWRLLVVLSRFGGLRCPSETLALTWGDIDWERNRIRVPSPKTEHHEGKDCRYIPMFPELRGPLMEVFDAAEPGTEHVITRYRDSRGNLRTQFLRIIRRAGLVPWVRPWHNMRSSRQTELAETYPAHVVCGWLGNSEQVAKDHYLQTLDSHFERAVIEPTEKAAQKAAHSEVNPGELECIPSVVAGGPSDENPVYVPLSDTECIQGQPLADPRQPLTYHRRSSQFVIGVLPLRGSGHDVEEIIPDLSPACDDRHLPPHNRNCRLRRCRVELGCDVVETPEAGRQTDLEAAQARSGSPGDDSRAGCRQAPNVARRGRPVRGNGGCRAVACPERAPGASST